jgi:hypothetical protein
VADQIDLEARLSRLAADVYWPPEPDLRARVRTAALVPRRPWFESRWALAAVAVVAIIAVLLAYTPTRTAIADFVNLHTGISHTSTLPTPSPLPTGPIGAKLGLGLPTTLEDARAHVTWAVLVPSSLGRPDEVYLQQTIDAPTGGEVTLVYGPESGLPVAGQTGASVLITEAQGRVDEQFFGKIIGSGTTVNPVTVAGHQGWWISGQPHEFFFVDSTGTVRAETLRLATNTLVFDVGGTVVRIEGNLTEQQAEQIAESLS